MNNLNTNTKNDTHPHQHLQMTYQAIMQQQPYTFQRFKDNDSILHMAIKENATMAALDIIRIEYNTYLHTVAAATRPKSLAVIKKNPLEPGEYIDGSR